MKTILCPVVLIISLSTISFGQTYIGDCFSEHYQEALTFLNQEEYDLAIKRLNDISILCPDQTDDQEMMAEQLLNDAYQTWMKDIEQQRLISYVRLMAMQASRIIDQGNYSLALRLAYHAVQTTDQQASSEEVDNVWETFGQAVYYNGITNELNLGSQYKWGSFSNKRNLALLINRRDSMLLHSFAGNTTRFIDHDPSKRFAAASFSPDDDFLAVAYKNGVIQLYDLTAHPFQKLTVCTPYLDALESVKMLAADKMIVFYKNGVVRLLNQNCEYLFIIKNRQSTLVNYEIAPSGKNMWLQYADGTIQIWDLVTLKKSSFISNKKNTVVYATHYFDDGVRVLSNTTDGKVAIYNDQGGQLPTFSNPIDTRFYYKSLVSKKDQVLVCATDGTFAVKNLNAISVLQKKDNARVTAAAFSPEGDYLALAFDNGYFKMYEVANGRLLLNAATKNRLIEFIQFSSNGKRILILSQDDRLAIMDSPMYILNQFVESEKPLFEEKELLQFKIDQHYLNPQRQEMATASVGKEVITTKTTLNRNNGSVDKKDSKERDVVVVPIVPNNPPSEPIKEELSVRSGEVHHAQTFEHLLEPESPPIAVEGPWHTVTKKTSLRAGPKGDATSLMRLAPGKKLRIIEHAEKNRYWTAVVHNGMEGWVKTAYLEPL